jgi:hypothetical protein
MVLHGRHIDSDVRRLVLNFAEEFKGRCKKRGDSRLWSADEYMIGYLDDKLIDKEPTHYKAFKGSKAHKCRVGTNSDPSINHLNPMKFRCQFCACESCYLPRFRPGECLYRDIFSGPLKSHNATRIKVHARAVTRSHALQDFARSLKSNTIVAVRVASDQQDEEGKFWLARTLSDGYQLDKAVVVAGEDFDEGFWVVNINWFERVQESRSVDASNAIYKELNDNRLLNVAAIMQIGEVELTPGTRRNRFHLDDDELSRIENQT